MLPSGESKNKPRFRVMQVDDRYASCCARVWYHRESLIPVTVCLLAQSLFSENHWCRRLRKLDRFTVTRKLALGQLASGLCLTVFTVGDAHRPSINIAHSLRSSGMVEDQLISELSSPLVWQRPRERTMSIGPRNMNPLIQYYYPPRLSKLCLSWH